MTLESEGKEQVMYKQVTIAERFPAHAARRLRELAADAARFAELRKWHLADKRVEQMSRYFQPWKPTAFSGGPPGPDQVF